jgi:hypothetical protein
LRRALLLAGLAAAAVLTVALVSVSTSGFDVQPPSGATATPAPRSASAGQTGASPSPLVVPSPAGVREGDVLVAAVAGRLGPEASVTPPAGWALVRRDQCSGPQRTELAQALFTKVAGSSEPSAYAFSFSEVTAAAGAVLAYTGVDPSSPSDGSSGRLSRNTGGIYAPSLTPTGDWGRLVVSFAHSGALSIPAPSGTTRRAESTAAAEQAVTLAVFDEALGSSEPTGERSSRGPVAQSCNVGALLLLRPAGDPASSPPSPPPTATPPPSPAPPPAATSRPPTSADGTTLTLTDTTWTCDRPVAQYATNGMPLRVVMDYTHNYDGFGVRLAPGCTGDGTSAIDLVLNVNGDGLTHGPQNDAVRVMNRLPGASDLEITGYANCGRRVNESNHQDGIQVLGGTNITWIDFEVGSYDAGRSTCQGAGGAFFYSLPSTNTRVVGGKYIACNHSLYVFVGRGHVTGASFRSGRNDGTDPACDYHSSNPCYFRPGVIRGPRVTCQRWNPATRRWEAR